MIPYWSYNEKSYPKDFIDILTDSKGNVTEELIWKIPTLSVKGLQV